MAVLQPSPVCVFELFSAGTSVVSAPQATSLCAPVSSSLSPVDSSSEDSLQRKGKRKSHSTEMTQSPKMAVTSEGKLDPSLSHTRKTICPSLISLKRKGHRDGPSSNIKDESQVSSDNIKVCCLRCLHRLTLLYPRQRRARLNCLPPRRKTSGSCLRWKPPSPRPQTWHWVHTRSLKDRSDGACQQTHR